MKKLLIALLAIIAFSSSALAHPGSLDANGGHWNHSTGEYHYHDGSSSSGSSSSSPSGGSSKVPSTLITTGNVNMRDGAGTSYGIITTIPEGTTLAYGGKISGNWYYVRYGFKKGWVHKDYARVETWENRSSYTSSAVKNTYKPSVTSPPKKASPTKAPSRNKSTKGKEILPLTIENVLFVFAIGLVVGLVVLAVYAKKKEEETQQRVSEAIKTGQRMAETNLKTRELTLARDLERAADREKAIEKRNQDLSQYERNINDRIEKFKKEAETIQTSFPLVEELTPVLVAEKPFFRSLYHSADSQCIATGQIVSMKTAQELNLRPCSRCRPQPIHLPTYKSPAEIIPMKQLSNIKANSSSAN